MNKMMKVIPLMLILCFSLVAQASASTFYVWMDTTFNGERDTLIGSINGYEGALTGVSNYNYYSYSAHPVNGPNPYQTTLKTFVYERTTNDRDFLNIMAGKDRAGDYQWHDFAMDIDVTGSLRDPSILQGDEPAEFSETAPDHFEGDWSFRRNTDGGVIGALTGDWEARIKFLDSDMEKHVFASYGSKNIVLDGYLREGVDTFFISSTDQPVVPEPATLLLLGSGLLGGAFSRRRKRS